MPLHLKGCVSVYLVLLSRVFSAVAVSYFPQNKFFLGNLPCSAIISANSPGEISFGEKKHYVEHCCDKTLNLSDTDLQAADDCGGGN